MEERDVYIDQEELDGYISDFESAQELFDSILYEVVGPLSFPANNSGVIHSLDFEKLDDASGTALEFLVTTRGDAKDYVDWGRHELFKGARVSVEESIPIYQRVLNNIQVLPELNRTDEINQTVISLVTALYDSSEGKVDRLLEGYKSYHNIKKFTDIDYELDAAILLRVLSLRKDLPKFDPLLLLEKSKTHLDNIINIKDDLYPQGNPLYLVEKGYWNFAMYLNVNEWDKKEIHMEQTKESILRAYEQTKDESYLEFLNDIGFDIL